jgi:hypothetical protein
MQGTSWTTEANDRQNEQEDAGEELGDEELGDEELGNGEELGEEELGDGQELGDEATAWVDDLTETVMGDVVGRVSVGGTLDAPDKAHKDQNRRAK